MAHLTTCRICKKSSHESAQQFKYGARHYACGACGIKKFGASFLRMIPEHMIPQLPYFALKDAGLHIEALKLCGLTPARQRAVEVRLLSSDSPETRGGRPVEIRLHLHNQTQIVDLSLEEAKALRAKLTAALKGVR